MSLSNCLKPIAYVTNVHYTIVHVKIQQQLQWPVCLWLSSSVNASTLKATHGWHASRVQVAQGCRIVNWIN